MTNKDEFELDVEETAEEEFDDVSLDDGVDNAEAAPPKKKKSGGGLMIFVLLLAVLGGGGFAAVKFLGVQLPFDVPGLTQTAQTPPAPAPGPVMSASADLPTGDLPPQPVVDTFAEAGGLPTGIPAAISPEEASINAPWGAEESVDIAAESRRQMLAEPFGDAPAPSDAGNIVDPFAPRDVTAAVNESPSDSPQPAPAEGEMMDPFASMTTAQTPVTPEPEAAPVAVTTAAPAEDTAAKEQKAALEKKLAETQKSLEASEKALKKANDDLAKKSEELAKAQADLKAAQKTAKAAADKPATTESKPAAVQTDKPATKMATKPAAPVRKIEWVLRSAKPGMAWVSEKGSSEMRTVGVGDTLAGIGKVTAITTDAQGRWVVNGTRGSINQ